MPIDFYTTTDTGLDESSSIKPYVDGESGVAATFNRPPENLRARTEALRKFADVEEMTRKAFTELAVRTSDGVSVTFDGAWDGNPGAPPIGTANSGAVRISGATPSIVVAPIGAPLTTNYASSVFTDVSSTYSYTVKAKVRAYQGGNRIRWSVIDSGRTTGNAVDITVSGGSTILDSSGTPAYGNDIAIDYISGATLADLQSAVVADPVASQLVGVSFDSGDSTQLLFDVSVPVTLSGGADAVGYTITDATLSALFSGDTNRLQAGDVLCIAFSDELSKLTRIIDAGTDAISSAELFNSRVNPDALQYSVPLFVASSDGTRGLLVDGTLCHTMHASVPGRGDWESYLASTAPGEGASLVGIADTGSNFAAADVEGALAEQAGNFTQFKTELSSNISGEGASLVGIEDTGGYYAGTTVEAALNESGSILSTAHAADVRRLVQYDGVISAADLEPTFNGTTGIDQISFTASNILVDGKYISVAPFTVGLYGSTGNTLTLNNADSSASLVWINSSGVPVLTETPGSIAKMTGPGIPVCRIDHTAGTTINAVFDVRRIVLADSDPEKLVVSSLYSPPDMTNSRTAMSQFRSVGSAMYWAEHQPTHASEHYTIEIAGTVDYKHTIATSPGSYIDSAFAASYLQSIDVNKAISLTGRGEDTSVLNIPSSSPTTASLVKMTSQKISDLRIVNSTTALTGTTAATLEIAGAAKVRKISLDVTNSSHTAPAVYVSGDDALITDITINNQLITSCAYGIAFSGSRGRVENLDIYPSSVVGGTAAVLLTNTIENNISGVVRGYPNGIEFSGSCSDDVINLDMDAGIVGQPLTPSNNTRKLTTIGVATTTFVPAAQFITTDSNAFFITNNAGTQYQSSDLGSVKVYAAVNIPKAVRITSVYVVGHNLSGSDKDILVSCNYHSSALSASHSLASVIVNNQAATLVGSTTNTQVVSVAATPTDLNWNIHDGTTPTSYYIVLDVTIPQTTTAGDVALFGIQLGYTVLAEDHRI